MKNKETLKDASLRIGLMEIELNHIKTLLASCEKALENRDNQAKKMYSEEDMMFAYKQGARLALISQSSLSLQKGKFPTPKEWFEQFKQD